jgi:ABC-type bacteriocin/lantibiotic exporter with double-glycine peptidase domain
MVFSQTNSILESALVYIRNTWKKMLKYKNKIKQQNELSFYRRAVALASQLKLKTHLILIGFVALNTLATLFEITSLILIGGYVTNSQKIIGVLSSLPLNVSKDPSFLMIWVVSSFSLRTLSSLAMHTASIQISTQLTSLILTSIFKKPAQILDEYDYGEYSNAANFLITEIVHSFIFAICRIITAILLLSFSLVIMLATFDAGIIIITLPLLIITLIMIYLSLQKIYQKNGQFAAKSSAELIGFMMQATLGRRELDLKLLRKYIQTKSINSQNNYRYASAVIGFWNELQRPIIEFILYAAVLWLTLFSAVINGELALAIMLASVRILPFLHSILHSLTQVTYARKYVITFSNLIQNYDTPREWIEVKRFETLALTNVQVSPVDTDPIFAPINYIAEKSKKVLIDGPSGTGKSLLLDAITKNMTLTIGSISINQCDIENIDVSKLITYVPQKVNLLNETIMFNICLTEDVDIVAFQKFLQDYNSLAIDVLINEFGAQRSIGENGSKLSGGQRQRIALARAIFNQSHNRLIILDEALSGLNQELELAIWQNLLESPLSIIAVSHNENTKKLFQHKISIKPIKEKGSRS